MTEQQEAYERFEQELQLFAVKHSITRIKISTLNFDRDFKLGQDTNLHLVSTKAIIRVLGKVTKVPIGEDEVHQTYESAYEATKKFWSEYYKGIRARRSDSEKAAEQRRQKRYRERKKARATELARRQ